MKETNLKKPTDDDEVKSRVCSILSYFTVLVLIGIPVWWYTTRVYRANLPLREMYDLEYANRTGKQLGIPLSLEYDVLISFVHPDPENVNIKLQGEEIERNISPFLRTIAPIAAFVTKSQWIYLTELGVVPTKVDDKYVLREHQLPHIITPLETKLWSHLSPRPTLNFVIYFPHCSSPLYIYNDKNEASPLNTFISARWGGIVIMNPTKESCETKIYEPPVQKLSSILVTILKDLLKMNSVEDLKLKKAKDMLDSSRRTLKSLAQLLLEINSIVISDEVANKINLALSSVRKAENFLENNNLNDALAHAKEAYKNSEEAFSDPSLLALLYFPDDQKYAIYIPLFLPVMIPVVISVSSIRKMFKKAKVKSE